MQLHESTGGGTMERGFRNQTLGAIVAANHRAASVLDGYGLDFCCGGKRTLEQACEQRHIDPAAVERHLSMLDSDAEDAYPDDGWGIEPLTRHIVEQHHEYVRAQAPIIVSRLAKLVTVHGRRHPELREVAAHFDQVVAEMQMHMRKEEEILFPYMRALAQASERNDPPPPNIFGTVKNPVRMMEAEHRSAGSELDAVRTLTHDFTVPDDGCATYRVGFEELEAFDRDLRLHIHLENNILFPKAVALEARMSESTEARCETA
jgi:regulator of cell morphogenesis and NO signaling